MSAAANWIFLPWSYCITSVGLRTLPSRLQWLIIYYSSNISPRSGPAEVRSDGDWWTQFAVNSDYTASPVPRIVLQLMLLCPSVSEQAGYQFLIYGFKKKSNLKILILNDKTVCLKWQKWNFFNKLFNWSFISFINLPHCIFSEAQISSSTSICCSDSQGKYCQLFATTKVLYNFV